MRGIDAPARVAGALAGGAMALAAAGAAQADVTYGDTIAIHESIEIVGSPQAIWAEYGGYCDLTKWIPVVLTCEYTEGNGELGSVRKLQLGGDLGEVVEIMSVKGPTLYTYEMTEGFLTDARYRSTVWATPGPTADTAVVHWRATILASAYPEDGGVGISQALEGVYADSLANLKSLVEF